eukprot:Pgem_evm1s402
MFGPMSHLTGGLSEKTSDGLDAVSESQRLSANLNKELPSLYEYNHINGFVLGPLKTDYSKPCPTFHTPRDRERRQSNTNCISLQEAVWGTKLLIELEAIKKMVDPNHILKCYPCVGFNYKD